MIQMTYTPSAPNCEPLFSVTLSIIQSPLKFIQFPNVIRDASGHRRANPRGAMHTAEIVMGNV